MPEVQSATAVPHTGEPLKGRERSWDPAAAVVAPG